MPIVLPVTEPPVFPLDPLTPLEQCQAVTLVSSDPRFPGNTVNPDIRTLFDRVELLQPNKSDVISFINSPGPLTSRQAFVAIYSPNNDTYYAITVDLINNVITSWNLVPCARPSWTNADNYNFSVLAQSSPEFIQAMIERGIPDPICEIQSGRIQFCVAVDGRVNNLACCDKKCSKKCKHDKKGGCYECRKDQPEIYGPPCGHTHKRSYYANAFRLDQCQNSYDGITPVSNYYIQPIAGVVVWTDENAQPCGAVLKVVNLPGTQNIPTIQGTIIFNCLCPQNSYYNAYDLSPANAAPGQTPTGVNNMGWCFPNGPSYTISPPGTDFYGPTSGNLITWDRWRLRFSMHPTWGLQLNLIEFNDSLDPTFTTTNYRPILYQANLAELMTLYGDPSIPSRYHNFLDLGEYQTRLYLSPLQRGVDAPPTATLLSPIFVNEYGNLVQVVGGLGVYEQDGGVLWRHYDSYQYIQQGRRNRQLVLVQANLVGNYDYLFYWIFNLDGTIEFKANLTGQDEYSWSSQTNANEQPPIKVHCPKCPKDKKHSKCTCDSDSDSDDNSDSNDCVPKEYATLIRPYLSAANHSHIFCLRLDFNINSYTQGNVIYQTDNTLTKPGKQNPCSNGWYVKNTLLTCEQNAKRDINTDTNRTWVVQNPNVKVGPVGHFPGYQIRPGYYSRFKAGKCDRMLKRAELLEHDLFVTKYHDGEYYPMGQYPVEQDEDKGLRVYTANNESLVNENLVVWYTMNFAHDPDVEDYPVLNAETVGLALKPSNFFIQNPAIQSIPDTFIDCDPEDPYATVDTIYCGCPPVTCPPCQCDDSNKQKKTEQKKIASLTASSSSSTASSTSSKSAISNLTAKSTVKSVVKPSNNHIKK